MYIKYSDYLNCRFQNILTESMVDEKHPAPERGYKVGEFRGNENSGRSVRKRNENSWVNVVCVVVIIYCFLRNENS